MNIFIINKKNEMPNWLTEDKLSSFLHENLKPFHDPINEIKNSFEYVFSNEKNKGGFIVIAEENEEILGSVIMLKTGLKGYIPENILLYVAVLSTLRGKGIGKKIIDKAINETDGDVKLHVEYDNPAKRLYERIGFTSKYAEMRFIKK